MCKYQKSPCYVCDKRTPTCHGYCKDYISWNRDRQIMLEEKRKKDNIQSQLNDTEFHRYYEIRRRRGKLKNRRYMQ